ncbi:hypothetical protein KIN20_019612 [Parelaphostrongylus tenuis]|uniref:Uncharacterized protein n=1 Tax=Parelaphostrongylus tenuis TaxID=148309 RepID=A0AAD5QT04_PARTN|nr:hypothetical protein KIN20_019612 [Parelaphostrongylus tenuis]
MVFGETLMQTTFSSECGHVSKRHNQVLDLLKLVRMVVSRCSQTGHSRTSDVSRMEARKSP